MFFSESDVTEFIEDNDEKYCHFTEGAAKSGF